MDSVLQGYPRPAMIVDGALTVVDCSPRCMALLGLRDEGARDVQLSSLTARLADDRALGDDLALATARLTTPGDEETISWSRDGRSWDVVIAAIAAEGGGEIERFMVLLTDVTDWQLEREIQSTARHYLEQILNDIPLGVAVFSSDLHVTSVNRQMLAYLSVMGGRDTLVEAIGAGVAELVPGDVGASWRALGDAVLAHGDAVVDARRAFGDGDDELVLATQVTPLRDRRNDLTGVIVMADDVTEEAHLQRDLVRAEKLATVGQMVITVNHEINNPLTIIAANAQSMRLLNKDMDDKGKKKLESIEKQVRRISEVTERLRTMDEVASSAYIEAGPDMVDIWRTGDGGDSDQPGEAPE